MKVAILTMFGGLSTTYSLVNVVAEQLHMLLENGIDVKLIVTEDCMDHEKWGIYTDDRIEWIKISNKLNDKQIELHDYSLPQQPLHETFYQEADYFSEQFIDALSDVDICIMHDILYQGWHYVHNIAIRTAQKSLPKTKFLAFTHSLPVNRPLNINENNYGRYTPMDNTIFIFPGNSGIQALANQYNVPEGYCRTIYNTVTLLANLSKDVQDLHKKVDLLSSDILIIYPARLSTGKKLEKVAGLAGSIKRINEKTVKVIFCDFACADTPSDDYKEAIRYVGKVYGLDDEDIVFTTDHGYEHGFPREAVLDLFSLSNLFICPSFSEAFSLTVLEAASRGNFLVLNERVPALEEAGKLLGAYFMKWDARNYGYDTKEKYSPTEISYNDKHSAEIVKLMREDPVCYAKTVIRKKFNYEWVWKNQLKPLLELLSN